MKLISAIGRSLGWKLLLSYMVIILIGVAVLAATARFQAPEALDRHIARMEALGGESPALVADLRQTFTAAVNDILVVAALPAIAAAVAVGLYTARRITRPIEAMTKASQRIARGDYHQRVRVPSADELGDLARNFNRMAATLERTDERRMELIGDVAHELRTPLGNITSLMEGLMDGVLPSEPATLQNVQREAARLQRLVLDLEELSGAEAGEIPLSARAVAVPDLIRAAADRLRTQFEDKGVDLELELRSDLPEARADPGRVIQVLLNLMGNALHYTPSGGEVTVRAHREDSSLVISVRDTGIGIAESALPQVFERFFRVDRSRSRLGGGSGIGLTIAKHLVEAQGGQIWASSSGPDQGSTFTFTLPLAD